MQVLHFDLGFGTAKPTVNSKQNGPQNSESSSKSRIGTAGIRSVADSDGMSAPSSSSSGSIREVVVLTTDPRAPPTHYQQLVLSFPRAVRVTKGVWGQDPPKVWRFRTPQSEKDHEMGIFSAKKAALSPHLSKKQ
jgi:hypothetical protein